MVAENRIRLCRSHQGFEGGVGVSNVYMSSFCTTIGAHYWSPSFALLEGLGCSQDAGPE